MLGNIEAERARLGLSKRELASKLGIGLRTYYYWIDESNDIPSGQLIKMAKLFGTDIDYLLEKTDEADRRGA